MRYSSDSLHGEPKPNRTVISSIQIAQDAEPRAEGIDLDDAPIGAVVEIETGHTTYRLKNLGNGNALLSGHPTYCPEPTAVQVQGSISATGELKWHFLWVGRRMVFLPAGGQVIRTSTIKAVRIVPAGSHN